MGFQGSRLLEAREARGLTVSALAELVGVSRQSLHTYERGDVTPGPAIMERICIVLDLPALFFNLPPRDIAEPHISFRSLHSTALSDRKRSGHRSQWLIDIAWLAKEYVDWPPMAYPTFDIPDHPGDLSDEDIESLADQTRAAWGLSDGPITNIVWLLENKGTIVARDEMGTEEIDAYSFWAMPDEIPFIVLGSEKGSAVRSRLDATHELGHLIMHRRVPPNISNRSEIHKLMEQQSFRFGSAFLMPRSSFGDDVWSVSLDSLLQLKPKWLVSVAAMIRRCLHLGLVSQQHYERLNISLSRKRWRKSEPLDNELPTESPRLLPQAMELILSEGGVHPDELLYRLGLSIADVASLSGINPAFLREPVNQMRLLPAARHRQNSTTDRDVDTLADVIDFPNGLSSRRSP